MYLQWAVLGNISVLNMFGKKRVKMFTISASTTEQI